jgi:hypothetical protein
LSAGFSASIWEIAAVAADSERAAIDFGRTMVRQLLHDVKSHATTE